MLIRLFNEITNKIYFVSGPRGAHLYEGLRRSDDGWRLRVDAPGGRKGRAAAICGRCTQLRLDLGVSAESQTARTSGKYPAKQLLVC